MENLIAKDDVQLMIKKYQDGMVIVLLKWPKRIKILLNLISQIIGVLINLLIQRENLIQVKVKIMMTQIKLIYAKLLDLLWLNMHCKLKILPALDLNQMTVKFLIMIVHSNLKLVHSHLIPILINQNGIFYQMVKL